MGLRFVFVLILTNALLCLSNASNGTVPVASVTCSDPGTPENARRDDRKTSFLPGDKVNFYCDFAYKLIGSHNITCLDDGSWSDDLPICQIHMCDELDAMPPDNGKRKGNFFTIGSKLKFRCDGDYKLIGEKKLTCLPNGQWSAAPPTCQHRCERFKCDDGEICVVKNRRPTCACRTNMQCSSRWDPICGSDGVSYNNLCIMKATACRTGKDIYSVALDKCLPGDICSIVPVSNCRASFPVYFYNVTEGKCKFMIAGGCHPSGWNGFFAKDECENYCVEDVCALKADEGPCNRGLKRWYYDDQAKKCRTFKYGGCFGNTNNFRNLHDCEARCGV